MCYVGRVAVARAGHGLQLRTAAEPRDRFAAGELRTTNMQNLLIVNVILRSEKRMAGE